MNEMAQIDDLVIEDLTDTAAGNCFGTLGSFGCPACFGTLGSFT
ncbi:MAG: thiocillin family RiPP [Nonomuraea sp.]|nr:thiocillin family RiPP [Nonomuraea sp.]